MMIARTMTTSLSCLAAAFLAKGFRPSASLAPKPSVASFRNVRRSPFAKRSFGARVSRLFSSASSSSPGIAAIDPDTTDPVVPITLLSGFLGSGKTTTLQHLLENRDGLKIGVIVNDVASVNIDAKLVKKSDSDPTSSSDSDSDSDNIKISENGVVELQNGCACCSLADEFLPTVETLLETKSEGEAFDAVVVELSGVGDPVAIQQHWKAARASGHPVTQRADMKRVVTLIDASTFGTDWMTWDVASDRDGWADPEECAGGRKVPELLAEQIESADVLLLNKVDLAGPKQLEVAGTLARSINRKAVLEEVEYGRVAFPAQIIRDDKAGTEARDDETEGNNAKTNDDNDNDDDGHDHSHAHSHQERQASEAEPTESTNTGDAHDHSHSHSHATAKNHLGIVNFVYRANRPFETRNLMSLLNAWPVPIKEDLEGLEHFLPSSAKDDDEPVGRESPFFGVLRSKGFCWLSPTSWDAEMGDQWRHDTAMYWSHAGKHFGIMTAGKWWATLDRAKMKEYFKNDPKEYERIRTQDFVTEKWGDRRQEIVFIGVNIDEERITKALDDCLMGDIGMESYTEQLNAA